MLTSAQNIALAGRNSRNSAMVEMMARTGAALAQFWFFASVAIMAGILLNKEDFFDTITLAIEEISR